MSTKSPKLVSFNPDVPPSHMNAVWIRGADMKAFYKTYMKAIPRTGDIIFDPISQEHLAIKSIQWFEESQHNWISIINLNREKKGKIIQ